MPSVKRIWFGLLTWERFRAQKNLAPRREDAECVFFALLRLGARFFYFCVVWCWLGSALAFAQTPPAAYQPADFNGAIGSFSIDTHAEPTTLRAGQPLVFTVHITARAVPQAPPRRPDLHRVEAFTTSFYIDDLPERDQHRAGELSWTFVYRLRPKPGISVDAVPVVPFVYYKSNLPPEAAYQTLRSPAISLTVQPATEAPIGVERHAQPDELYQLETGLRVLRHDQAADWPAWLLALGLALPPLACVGWCLAWQRRHPEANRRLRQRQSGAARHALHLLQADGQDGQRTVAAVTGYLQQRLGLLAVEPTPTEVIDQLHRVGVSAAVAQRTADFYRQSDRQRFGPPGSNGQDALGTRAVQLIQAIEEEQEKRQSP